VAQASEGSEVKVKQRKTFVVLSLIAVLAVVAVAAGGADAVGRGMYRLVGLVGQIVALVRSSYVEEVPVERLELGAIGGLVDAADPGGAWVPEEHAAAFAAASGRLVPAFGMVLGRRASYPYVIEVVPASPAAAAGLQPGEYIERIGSEPVRARPLWLSIVLLDRAAEAGESVTIDVIDRAVEDKRQVTLKSGGAPSLAPVLDTRGDIPVLRVPALTKMTVARIDAVLQALPAGALVIDLRGTGLGNPEAAIEAAAKIAGGEIEAPRQARAGDLKPLKASGQVRQRRIFVCVDPTTAGAAEVLAASLKRRGATLVGAETYGDTGVRQPQHVAGGQLWLASEWFLGPDGKPLLGAGLKPDEAVRMRREGDPVLDRALELAHGQALPKAA
jgi:carboxyl-terminal processing protease